MYFTKHFTLLGKNIVLFFILGFLLNATYSQEGIIANYERVLEDIFYSDYKFAEMNIDSITTKLHEKDGRLYYVHYNSRGFRMRAEYSSRLIWEMTYIYVPFEELPRPCQRYISDNYLTQGYNASSIRYQDAPSDSYYKVDVIKDITHYQLRFNDDGDFIGKLVRD